MCFKKLNRPFLFCLHFVIVLSFYSQSGRSQDTSTFKVILDADTGNEVDDYYALVRALIEPSWEITSLNATQWQSSQWSIPATMENSHRLNQVLLGEMEMDIKTRRGGIDRMFDWGDMAQHSAAAYEIIRQSKELENGELLNIVALGALTNIASAIYIEPKIAEKIRLYWLGTTYDFEKDILKRQDFNCMMDQQALEIVLMSNAELYIMPINIAVEMKFNYGETLQSLPKEHGVSSLLLDRWKEHLDGGRLNRIIWDLALVQAIIFPEWASFKEITTSKDYGKRKIYYFDSIAADNMKKEFFSSLKAYFATDH